MQQYENLKLKNQLCFPLYAASKEVVRKYRPYLDPLGLTYTQYIVMLVLWEEERVTVKSLGAKLYLDSGTLTPLLKNLERKGLVNRTRWENDERVLFVTLTPEGEALKERVAEIPSKIAEDNPLSAEECSELCRILNRILAN